MQSTSIGQPSADGGSSADGGPIVVVFAADEAYAMPLAAAVRSLFDNAAPGRRLHVYIIDCGLSASSRERLDASWNLDQRQQVTWKDAPVSKVERLPVWGHFGRSVYYRLLIPQILPPDIPRAIYLDSDVLVLGELAPLFDHDLAGRPVGAVRDAAIPIPADALAGYRQLGLAADTPYFNSGVMLMDLDRWRSEDIGARVLTCVDEKREWIRWPDQDALNVTLAGGWTELETRWNVFVGFLPPRRPPPSPITAARYAAMEEPPRILHFVATEKPWSPEGQHADRKLFLDYVDRTAWSGWRPDLTIRLRPYPPALRVPRSQPMELDSNQAG